MFYFVFVVPYFINFSLISKNQNSILMLKKMNFETWKESLNFFVVMKLNIAGQTHLYSKTTQYDLLKVVQSNHVSNDHKPFNSRVISGLSYYQLLRMKILRSSLKNWVILLLRMKRQKQVVFLSFLISMRYKGNRNIREYIIEMWWIPY